MMSTELYVRVRLRLLDRYGLKNLCVEKALARHTSVDRGSHFYLRGCAVSPGGNAGIAVY